MESTRAAYASALSSASSWRSRLDSAWASLGPLRSAAVTTAPDYSRAEQLRRDAQSAENTGDPELALERIARAAEAYRLTTRATEPATPEPTAPAPDEILNQTLVTLRRAIEAEDLNLVRAIWSGLTAEQASNFESFFEIATDLRVSFEVVSMTASDDLIEATVRTTYVYRDNRGREQTPPSFEQRLDIGQRSGRWIVVRSRG